LATEAIARSGGEVEFYECNALIQGSGHANWDHGEIFLTPSRGSALRYAQTGGAHGGELLTMCAEALQRLGVLNVEAHEDLIKQTNVDLQKFLQGGGRPMLVLFDDMNTCDLDAERRDVESVRDVLIRVPKTEDPNFDILTQQSNFRVKPGRGRVSRLELVDG
jgi:hypothetical protein